MRPNQWEFRIVQRSLSEQLQVDHAAHDFVPFGARVEVVAAVRRGRKTRRLLGIAGRRVEIDDRVEAARPACWAVNWRGAGSAAFGSWAETGTESMSRKLASMALGMGGAPGPRGTT
jgi:hypothetical protein